MEFVPYDRLMTRMFIPLSLRCCTTQSMAAITWDTSTPPSAVATFTATIRASGAIPRYADAGADAYGAVRVLSLPAITPAMNVPCPLVSRLRRFGAWDSNDRSGPWMTLPAVARPSTGATPVSITATSTPAPVYPAFHHAAAPR